MRLRAVLFVFGFWMSFLAQTAHALPTEIKTCGQTLSAAGEYILANNLNCSGTSGDYTGVTITASNVTLYLAGHEISSEDCDLNRNISGILVAGGITNVKIIGGAVSGFNDGIVLSSSKSQVVGVTVKNACEFGILVQGAHNAITTNTVTTSGDGVVLSPSDDSRVVSNNLSGNVRAGVVISDDSERNTIAYNILDNNGANSDEGYGVAVFNGSGNTIRNNAASYNDIGIRVSAPNNAVNNNTVSGNSNYGVWLAIDGSPSSVRRNSVFGSGKSDMLDESPLCGGNVWRNNKFSTDLVNGVSDAGPGGGCIK